MPIKLLASLASLLALTSCYPDKPCSGQLVFDDATALCYACPQGSTYKNQTCECKEGYAYISHACMLMDGAMPSIPDAGDKSQSDAEADASAYEVNGCKNYCSFATTCLGGNSLASVLSDVVMGLHADNATACQSSCKSDLGSNEASDPAIACIEAGQEAAMCNDPNPQTGLMKTFGLIGQCCGPNAGSELCKSICKALKASPITASMVPFCP